MQQLHGMKLLLAEVGLVHGGFFEVFAPQFHQIHLVVIGTQVNAQRDVLA